MYIQHIEETYESTSKGKYFLITTKTDYRKVLTEANDMIKYIYPDRVTTELKTSIQRSNIPIIYNNASYLCTSSDDLPRIQPSSSTIFKKATQTIIQRQLYP